MFDVRRLVVFREVVRAGSLSAAAAALSYTTSAVSQQIAALEREVGVALLVRGPNGARPTPAGHTLLDHSTDILTAIERAERDLVRPESTAVLRVASFASAAAAILPAALAELRFAHPHLRPTLVAADPDDGVALLTDGEVEAAVITEVPGERSPYPGVVTAPVPPWRRNSVRSSAFRPSVVWVGTRRSNSMRCCVRGMSGRHQWYPSNPPWRDRSFRRLGPRPAGDPP